MEPFIHFFLLNVKDCILCPYFYFGIAIGSIATYFIARHILSRGEPISENDRAMRLSHGRSSIAESFQRIKTGKGNYNDAYCDIVYFCNGTMPNGRRKKILNLVRKSEKENKPELLDKALVVYEDS